MYSKFPVSLEHLPRQSSFGCFSLKFGAVLSGIIVILYSVLSIAQCIAIITIFGLDVSVGNFWGLVALMVAVSVMLIHAVTLMLSAVMSVGVIKENARLIKPWVVWVSIQVMVSIFMFVFWSTMHVVGRFRDTSLVAYMFEFLILLIRFYMLILVASYYKQLEEEKGQYDRLVTIMSKENWYSA